MCGNWGQCSCGGVQDSNHGVAQICPVCEDNDNYKCHTPSYPKIQYLYVEFATRAIRHVDELPVNDPPQKCTLSKEELDNNL